MKHEQILANFFHDNTGLADMLIISFKTNVNVKNSNTDNVFINYILQCGELKTYFAGLVDSMFSSLVDTTVYVSEIEKFKAMFMINFIVKSQCIDKKQLGSSILNLDFIQEEILRLVSSLVSEYFTECEEKTNVISRTMASINNIEGFVQMPNVFELITSQTMGVITNFKAENTHSKTMVNDDSNSNPLSEVFTKTYESINHKRPSVHEINRFVTFATDYETISKLFLKYNHAEYDQNFENIVLEFNYIFKREITVYEYRKFYSECQTVSSKSVFSEYLVNYNERFSISCDIYKKYFAETLTYMIFCNTFLKYIELPIDEFVGCSIELLVNTGDYMTKMKTNISKTYMKLYKKKISDLDHEYFFGHAHRKKLSLDDEQFPQFITGMKNITDKQLEEINTIFTTILLRNCDEYEERKYIEYYRNEDTQMQPSVIVADELYESLEYKDVIKEWVSNELQLKNKSIIYEVLKYIYERIPAQSTRELKSILPELQQEFSLYFGSA